MQITWIAALLALGLSEVASVSVLCQSNCESNLVHYKEEACEVWRSRLPRPDLYNNCGQGYILGKAPLFVDTVCRNPAHPLGLIAPQASRRDVRATATRSRTIS